MRLVLQWSFRSRRQPFRTAIACSPVLPGGSQVLRAAGKRGRGPQQPAEGVGEDLNVHSVTFVLPEQYGVSAAIRSIGSRVPSRCRVWPQEIDGRRASGEA